MKKEDYDIHWIITFALCFVAGGLGVHRFYNGKYKTGLLMLYLTDLLPIATPLILLDLALILTGVFKIER
ncbi:MULTISPECIES: TM2 domain-containing protein [Psychrilyobacter]|uniref:NINE protein n=1 Tax=Psychrilyobacter piezotolerans TaxID=2293438 RepID=A0ABX9KJ05_9FUSO|nr:TM2 domain-containing protein [Psychrilyobacter piezotolerans]RDE64157.1 TM2 domain-containing protein [Psychrilyobacter sp. S5]REI42249.1 NINE protein [Psychrilyobacter piezotolerans]